MKRPSARWLVAILLLVVAPGVGAAPPSGDSAIVVVDSADPAMSPAVARELEALGARLPHRFTSGILVGDVPAEAESAFRPPDGASVRILREGREWRAGAEPADLPAGIRAARLFLQGPTRAPRSHELVQPSGDVLEPEGIDRVPLARGKALGMPECDRPAATSAFLAGRVAVGILLPESVGPVSTEDWTTEDPARPGVDRRDLVVAEIMEGCDALAAQLPEAGLTFIYDVHRDIGIDLEPILHPTGERGLWIREIMEELAFAGFSESASVSSYLNDLRERPGVDADWAVAAFVGDNLAHPRDGWGNSDFPFAYALLGGPYLVMNYRNDGFGIANMDAVMKHELAHCFGALDEYASAGNACTSVAGYLRVPNQNNDSTPACATDASCIMRGGTPVPVCSWSLGQLGIRDSDGDGILDVRDAPPDSRLDGASPLLLSSPDVTLTGLVTALARPEESPDAPATWTINRVTSAEWRLDGGAWQPLASDDGSFGDRCERFTIPLTGLAEGWHDVEVRGTNDVGLTEPSPAALRLYVNADCADDASEPDDALAQARARPARSHGGLHHCAFDDDWSRFHLIAGAALGVTLRYSNVAAALALHLLDAAGHVLATGVGVGPGEVALAHVATADGTHHLRVSGPGEDESPYSLDIVAACIDDPLEPNATPSAAPLVDPRSHPDMVLCAGDLDHFAVSVQAGEALSASLAFDGSLGDLDLEILDPTGASAGLSNGMGDSEIVSIPATTEGVHVVKVSGKTPLDSNVYLLDVSAGGCPDDLRENDDDPASARELAAGSEIRMRLCAPDEDWYAVSVPARRLVRLVAAFDAAACNLDLELRDATGATLLRQSSSLGGLEEISSERLAAGTYLLRVFSRSGGSTPYTLRFQSVDPILLMVAKDPSDAILTWSEAEQECYVVRRSETPSDFTGAVETLIQDGDEAVPDREMRDRGVILDGRFLYCYLVDASDCGGTGLRATKTARPSPVLQNAIGAAPVIEYAITLTNDGRADAFGVAFTDDVPRAGFGFTVLEIPPGATDASLPAPAGAYTRGLIQVLGINVPRGGSAIIRFSIQVNRATVDLGEVVDNQGSAGIPGSAGGTPVTPTDDPVTRAFEDDTRVMIVTTDQRPHVRAMWHQHVDLDVRVVDPCGNAISSQDLPSATCGSQTINLAKRHSCAVPSFPTRFESFDWSSFAPPEPGDYRVEVAYPHSSADEPACRGRGEEEVTVAYIPPWGTVIWTTVTIPEGSGFVPVLSFTVP